MKELEQIVKELRLERNSRAVIVDTSLNRELIDNEIGILNKAIVMLDKCCEYNNYLQDAVRRVEKRNNIHNPKLDN